MSQRKRKLKSLLDRIDRLYAVKAATSKSKCQSNSDCLGFTRLDNMLADVISNIRAATKNRSIPVFSVSMKTDMANLRKRCGTCCTKISYKARNATRKAGLAIVGQFKDLANKWLQESGEEIGADTRAKPFYQNNVKRKNPMI